MILLSSWTGEDWIKIGAVLVWIVFTYGIWLEHGDDVKAGIVSFFNLLFVSPWASNIEKFRKVCRIPWCVLSFAQKIGRVIQLIWQSLLVLPRAAFSIIIAPFILIFSLIRFGWQFCVGSVGIGLLYIIAILIYKSHTA